MNLGDRGLSFGQNVRLLEAMIDSDLSESFLEMIKGNGGGPGFGEFMDFVLAHEPACRKAAARIFILKVGEARGD